MIGYEKFKRIFEKIEGEPEIEITFKNRDDLYMIIKYKDYITFQRCGINNGSGEIKYNSIDELYNTKTIDDIILKNDWDNIKEILVDECININDYQINE